MEDNELKGRLDRLANRGTPRGADQVLEAAQASATVRPISTIRRFTPVLAVAAAVSLIAGVAGAIAITRDDPPSNLAANPLGTVPPSSTTTEAPVPEVSIPARLIAQSRLVPFNTCGAVTSYMRAQALRTVSAYGLPSYGGYGMGGDMVMRNSAGRPTAAAAGAAEDSAAPPQSESKALAATDADQFSSTNVQEAGIDEPDVIKTDGKKIYALNDDKLFIVDPNGPKIVGSITVGYANQLFLVGNKVMVFSVPQNAVAYDQPTASSSDRMIAPQRYEPKVRIAVIDVSNPAAPKETSHLDVDGGYVSARLVDGVARVVLASYPTAMPFVYPSSDDPQAQQAALENNRKVVRDAKFDDWVPGLAVTTNGKTTERAAVTCADAYRPPEFSGFGMLSVLSVDPANAAAAKAASVVADGQIVYASASRLYVATNQWGDVRPMAGAAPMIQPVPKTLIHQFDISDPSVAKYLVSGSVRGTMLNQFSMSEHAGVLRVATTENNESFVTTLANQSDKVLTQVGQVGGLGKNERIYAVRFIGPVGYVVTFRQVDPLYVIDLRDPAKPRVTGELKITGYSAYLHPVSDTLLIGVGQDATEEGRRLGTQVSLFDVSNPAAPKLLQKHAMGQGDSPAEFDHHAFLYWAPKKLTVIPISQYNANSGSPAFMGAIGLFTAPSEIREVGRVSHDNNNLIQRSLVIGSHLFTYSNGGIKASSIDNLAEQGWAPFPNAPQYQKGEPGQTEPGSPPDRGTVEPQPAQ